MSMVCVCLIIAVLCIVFEKGFDGHGFEVQMCNCFQSPEHPCVHLRLFHMPINDVMAKGRGILFDVSKLALVQKKRDGRDRKCLKLRDVKYG